MKLVLVGGPDSFRLGQGYTLVGKPWEGLEELPDLKLGSGLPRSSQGLHPLLPHTASGCCWTGAPAPVQGDREVVPIHQLLSGLLGRALQRECLVSRLENIRDLTGHHHRGTHHKFCSPDQKQRCI